jgi:hypothetical protein
MIIQKLQEIGQGANSKIYLGEFQQGTFHGNVALKEFSWNSVYKISNTIATYQKLKSAGIPTLAFCQAGRFEGQEYLVMEHINLDTKFKYVSYNTLNTGHKADAELIRAEIKLEEIIDFSYFLYTMRFEIANATQENISLYFDSYFFGSEIAKSSKLTYKIVDLDNVEFFNKYKKEHFELNLAYFRDAIIGFIKYFVIKEHQNVYLKSIDQLK